MPSTWSPFKPSVLVHPGPHASRISLVRHDGYPYEEDWDEGGTGWPGLFDIANRYLALVNPRLKLPPQWLADLRALIDAAPQHLAPGGWLLLEHGWDQADAVAQHLAMRGFAEVGGRRDLAGRARASGGRWPA